MPFENPTWIVFGFAGLLVVWLVFSLLRKAMGIALLIVAALVAYMLWSNPEMLQAVTGAIWSRFGQA